jgi:purine nucleosidase
VEVDEVHGGDARQPVVRVILDVDTGTDDAGALLLAATHPDLELVATTATWGNCSRDQAARNTLAVLRAAGSGVPVHPGAEGPSGPAPWHDPADTVMGRDGLGNVGVQPPAGATADAEDGPAALVRLARSMPGELTLVALAPLTTVAAALAIEPALPSLLAGLVVMGGSIAVGGNVTALAEANVGHDPQAAAAVVDAFGRARPSPCLVPLDATLRAPLTEAELGVLAASPLPGAALLHQVWSAVWPTSLLETGVDGAWPAHDLLAAWTLVDPEVCRWETVPLAVDTGGSAAWGATVADRRLGRFTEWAGDDPERLRALAEANTVPPGRWRVAVGADAERFRRGVRGWLAGSSSSAA